MRGRSRDLRVVAAQKLWSPQRFAATSFPTPGVERSEGAAVRSRRLGCDSAVDSVNRTKNGERRRHLAAPDPEAPRADGCSLCSVPSPNGAPQPTDVGCSEPPEEIVDVGAERQTRAGLARETQKPSARPRRTSPSVSTPSAVGAPRGGTACRRPTSRQRQPPLRQAVSAQRRTAT